MTNPRPFSFARVGLMLLFFLLMSAIGPPALLLVLAFPILIIPLGAWATMGLFTAAIAGNRGDSQTLWFMAGVIFGPLGLAAAYFETGTRCPQCQSKIHTQARICPRCQREQPPNPTPQQRADALQAHNDRRRQNLKQNHRAQVAALTRPFRHLRSTLARGLDRFDDMNPEAKAMTLVITLALLATLALALWFAVPLIPTPHFPAVNPRSHLTTTATGPSSSHQATTKGHETIIDWPDGKTDPLWLGVNQEAYSRMLDAANAHDTIGLKQMALTGQIFTVKPGTRVLLLDPGFLGSTVRVLEGPARGRKAITAAEYVRER